ncbi:MAG: peptidyl-prolyl cis-trans isomerase [Alphaproteobacteria bacterium]|nr:peptidyl-prolyl cis-trans isomerase [Alphaproteobacteria bacterium]
MKLKLACASAVLTFLCYDLAWGGALKNSFTKNKTEVESQNKETEKSEETAQTNEASSKPAEQVVEQAQTKEVAKKKEIKGNPVIFRIGNKEIRRDEILADIKTLPVQLVQQTPADKLFDIMKRQKLMTYLVIEQAKKAGMDREKEYIQQIDKLKERVLFETYLIKELEPKASNETTLKSKYQQYLVEFKSGKEIKISTIALNTEKEAKDVINALSKGAPFDKLQKDKGLSALSENSDRYVPVSRMPEDLKSKFKEVAKNAVTKEPIKIADAYHVLKITDMRDSKPGTFEEIKPILSQLILRDEMEKLIKKLENQYKVQKFNEDGTPEVAPSTTTSA